MNKRFFFWSVIWFSLKQTKIDYLKPMTMTCYFILFFYWIEENNPHYSKLSLFSPIFTCSDDVWTTHYSVTCKKLMLSHPLIIRPSSKRKQERICLISSQSELSLPCLSSIGGCFYDYFSQINVTLHGEMADARR